MTHVGARVDVGSFTSKGYPLPSNFFGNSRYNGLGVPTYARVALLDGIPVASYTMSTSASVAANAVFVLIASLQVTQVGVTTTGSNYAVGDILTGTGGTVYVQPTFLVEAVTTNGQGGLAAVRVLNPGIFSVAPTGFSGGNGSGGALSFTTAQSFDTLGNKIALLDFPQTLNIQWTGAATITVNGYDALGRKTGETLSSAGNTKKAYSAIYQVTTSASITSASIALSTTQAFGMPVLCNGSMNFTAFVTEANGTILSGAPAASANLTGTATLYTAPGHGGWTLSAAGTGYAVGDLIVLTPAGASLPVAGLIDPPVVQVLTLSTTAVATFQVVSPGLMSANLSADTWNQLSTTGAGSAVGFTFTPSLATTNIPVVVTGPGGSANTMTFADTTNPPTATSGDPLGLFTFGQTIDGTSHFSLLADLPYNYLNCAGNEQTTNPQWVYGVTPYTNW